MLIRAGRKSREDTGSNIGAGGGGVVDMATGGTVDQGGRSQRDGDIRGTERGRCRLNGQEVCGTR